MINKKENPELFCIERYCRNVKFYPTPFCKKHGIDSKCNEAISDE